MPSEMPAEDEAARKAVQEAAAKAAADALSPRTALAVNDLVRMHHSLDDFEELLDSWPSNPPSPLKEQIPEHSPPDHHSPTAVSRRPPKGWFHQTIQLHPDREAGATEAEVSAAGSAGEGTDGALVTDEDLSTGTPR